MTREERLKELNKPKEILCKECKRNGFEVTQRVTCEWCPANGYQQWIDEDNWTWAYNENDREGAERCQAEEGSGCKHGDAMGAGCVWLACQYCGTINILPYAMC